MIKQILAFLLLLFVGQNAQAQSQATIGNGDFYSNYEGPVSFDDNNRPNMYSRYAYIYTQSELAAVGITPGAIIKDLAWFGFHDDLDLRFSVYLKQSPTITSIPSNAPYWFDYRTDATLAYDTLQYLANIDTAYWFICPVRNNGFRYTGGSLLVLTSAHANTFTGLGMMWKTDNISSYRTGTWRGYTDNLPYLSQSNKRPMIRMNFAPAVPCSGVPTAGVASILPSCGPTVNLKANNASSNLNVQFQWQQSLNNTTWANVTGGSGMNDTAYIPAAPSILTYYRLKSTCTNAGGGTINSNAVAVQPNNRYAPLPYATSFENTWVSNCTTLPYAKESPDSFWVNNPLYGAASMRRNDADIDESGWDNDWGGYMPAASQGTYSARFHSYDGGDTLKGALSLYLNLSTAGTKSIRFDRINPSGTDSLWVQLSEDGGATFTNLARYGVATEWTSHALTTTSTAVKAVLRFSGYSASLYDEYDDIGIDNLSVSILVPCSGRPTAGTINITPTSCPGFKQKMIIQGTPFVANVTYRWQKSANGTTWTSITGATQTTYEENVWSTTSYRMIAVCANSGLADTTPVKTIPIIKNYATIPYKTSFENWTTRCATAPYSEDVPDNFWVTNPTSGDASVRRTETPNTASGWLSIFNGLYLPFGSDSLHSARFHSAQLQSGTKGTFDLLVNLNTPSVKTLSFDHICSSNVDSLHVWLSEDGGVTFSKLLGSYSQSMANDWEKRTATINSNSATCVIRFLFVSGHSGEDIGIDNLSIAAVCNARPVAGIISTPSVSCPNSSQIFTTTGSSIGLGIIYQWQKSINGTTWANVAGATTTTLEDTLRVKSYYRMLAICTRVGLADTTPVVTANVNATIFARLPYATSFENEWATRCVTQAPYARDVPDSTWLNTPTFGDGSVRRNDEALWASGWSGYYSTSYSPEASNGQYSVRYNSYGTTSNKSGTLDLYINLSDVGNKVLTFDHIAPWYQDRFQVELSEDGGLTFPQILGSYASETLWAKHTLTIRSNAAKAVIRFRFISVGFIYSIGLDNVAISIPCTTRPTAGTIVGPTFMCAGSTVNMATVGTSSGIGIVYQWQKSSNGTTWANIVDSTTTRLQDIINANTFYRLIATCTGSNASDTTPQLAVSIAKTYAPLPYSTSFEQTWVSRCVNLPFGNNAPDNFWLTTPVSGNTSVRRSDKNYTLSGWSVSPTQNGYLPEASMGNYSARFHSYNAANKSKGTLDLYINLNAIGSKSLIFDHINPTGLDSVYVQLSENGGATFPTTLAAYGVANAWKTRTISINSTSATAVIRFSFVADYGADDIGIDNLSVSVTPCASRPIAGTLIAPNSVCQGNVATLRTSSLSQGLGIGSQWQKSTNGINWQNTEGSLASLVDTILVPTRYRLIATCAATTQSDTTTSVLVGITPTNVAILPFYESFENWQTKCTPTDFDSEVPNNTSVAIPTYGSNSWRRDDQIFSAGWGLSGLGSYAPRAASGQYSARFHTAGATIGSKGSMNFYLNFNQTSRKEIAFDYINTSGADSLRVMMSIDSGATFQQLGTTLKTATTWTRKTFVTTANTPLAILRLEATSDKGTTDIGVDSLSVVSCTVTASIAAAGPTTFCQGDSVRLAARGAGAYSWITPQGLFPTPTIWAKQDGVYTLTVNAGNCSATDAVTVTVNPKPTANFTFTATGGNVSFVNNSVFGTNYLWSFGYNGATSTQQDTSFKYPANGPYTVKLLVSNGFGCRDSVSQIVNITRVATAEVADIGTFKYFPNPVSSLLTVQFEGDTKQLLQTGNRLIVTNILGQPITTLPLTSPTLSINTENWVTGVYFLTTQINGKYYRLGQVIKQE